jgi:hypothetical protein
MYKVYRNLNNGMLSIKDSKTGLVVGHADAVDVFLAKFRVSKKGVERIRREKCRSVVATVDGGISWMDGFVSYKGRGVQQCSPHVPSNPHTHITFDPYKYDAFVDRETKKPLTSAELVVINGTGWMIAWSAK